MADRFGGGLIQLENSEYDRLLTHICTRGMTGLELAEKVADRWHGLNIVLMTGFAASVKTASVPWPLLQKPIELDRLLEAVRTALDADVSVAADRPSACPLGGGAHAFGGSSQAL